MDIIDSFLLGLIQGLTEFLPISSSGHLVLAGALLGDDLERGITFEVVVHFGTLCSILLYYRTRLLGIARSLWKSVLPSGPAGGERRYDPNVRLAGFILISMIPALLVGLLLRDRIEEVFLNPFTVSLMLLATGAILFATRFRATHPNRLGAGGALGMGLAQALAILPGISRSGATISLALYLGIRREEAANFSFLMVIPVIAGAMLLEVLEMTEKGAEPAAGGVLLVGFLTAFVTGYFALKYLIIMLKTRGIHPFAWYCWLLGGLGLLYYA